MWLKLVSNISLHFLKQLVAADITDWDPVVFFLFLQLLKIEQLAKY